MAEYLVASGSRKISALTSVSGISGSTSMPVVMGGGTVQISHTNFLSSTLLTQANTFSGNNTFGGQTTLQNGLVNGSLVVNGDITANQFIVSSSVSYITTSFSSGSTQFGDSIDDTHQFTGSVSITGSFLVNGIAVDGSSLNSFTQSVNTFSASVAAEINSLQDVTGSYATTSSLNGHTASLNAYTSSNDGRVNSLITATGSYALRTTFNSYTASNDGRVNSLISVTGSYVTTSSFNTFSSSIDNEVNSIQEVTASLNAYTASNDARVNSLISVTGSYATTGSNIFRGNQIVSASVDVSGSVNADMFKLDVTSTAEIPVLNTPFNLDLSGSGEYGGDNFIKKTLVLGDGKVLIAGRFQSIDGHTTNDIARLNSNGTIDTSFTSPIFGYTFGEYYGYINTFVTQSDGKILVGGTFDQVDGNAREGIARLNTNGTLDVSFATQSWSSFAEVKDIAIQNDGKIVCVGYFTSGSRRINTDGTLDASFNVSTGSSNPSFFNNDYFYSVALLPSGSEQAILIGGDFQQWGSFSDYNYIVKLHTSGSLDFGFAGTNLDIASSFGDRIQKIKVGEDGYIYVAGRFRDTGIGNHAGFARITTADEGNGIGALDNGFRTYITGSFVNDFDFYAGDKILLGGSFTTFGNPAFSTTSANRFVIVDQNDGGLMTGWFANGLASKYNLNTGSVSSVTLLSGDNVLVGGTFTSASFPSTAREGLASLKLSGFGSVTSTSEYQITANTSRLLISSSNTHFSGDVNISGSISVSSITGSLSFNSLTNRPTLVSGSSQISYLGLSNIPNGIISSSAQIDGLFNIDGLVSSSQQVLDYGVFTTTASFNTFTSSYRTGSFTGSFVGDGSGLTGVPGTTPINTGSFATTGSNIFRGNQIITGSLTVSGSSTFTNIGPTILSGSVNISGSVNADVFELGTPTTYIENTAYWLYGSFVNDGAISFGFSEGNSIANIDNIYINETSSDLNGAAIVNSLSWISGLVNGDVITIQGIDSSPSNLNQTITVSVNSVTDFEDGTWNIGVSVVSYLPLAGAAAVNGSLYSLTYSTAVGDGSQYTITADASRLLVSSSNTHFSGDVNIIGSVSASLFTGSFVGDGSGLTGVPGTTPINTGSFAVTGSNTFRGNQIVTGSVVISGSISQVGVAVQSIVITDTPITTLTSATGLTAVGFGSGESITTGYDNTFIGNQAGRDNDTGYVNTFVGAYAGALNTSGIFNTFIGRAAGQFNTTGERNTFVGTIAGQVSTGNYNTFLGSGAGALNTSAGNNTFLGTEAGGVNTLGTQNTFVGRLAGQNNSVGNNNTILGASAGNNNASGSSNTFVGRLAGTYIADGITQLTGSNNSLFLGTETKANANSETNQIVIGHQAVGNGSNTVTIGNNSITDTYLEGTLNISTAILSQVSQSLEFANDAAAAAGGVPLGGLYRSGNFILIRLV